jgi:predicted small secreted protein
MRIFKAFLALVATAVLLAGCATGEGGMGSDSQMTGSGPNGYISPGNPFGIGTGPGMSR